MPRCPSKEVITMKRPALVLLRFIQALILGTEIALPSGTLAQNQADLAKAAQNPVAAMISLPLQNNVLFGVGPDDDVANVLNIQPVIPVTVGKWNLINRTIMPMI
jgi:hypothetical protein